MGAVDDIPVDFTLKPIEVGGAGPPRKGGVVEIHPAVDGQDDLLK